MTTKSTKSRAAKQPGSVTFVGTGPGDPGLLTVRAVEALAAAEVVIFDSPREQSARAGAGRRRARRRLGRR